MSAQNTSAPPRPDQTRDRRPGGPVRFAACIVLIIVGYALPTVLGGSNVVYTVLVLAAIFAVMSYGVDVILSYLGEVSLGHTLFWAVGAYAAAMITLKLEWPPLLSFVSACALATALAAIIGIATIRTREFVFSLVTYAAAIIGLTVVSSTAFFGGSDGFYGLPALEIRVVNGYYTVQKDSDVWPLAYVLLVVTILIVWRFRHSRLGVSALMAQMNPDLATSIGVSVPKTRVLVFILSAPITAAAGWLYAFQRSYVGPDLLSPFFLLFMLTAVILPGRRLLFGPIVGALILTCQQQLFSFGGDIDKLILGGGLALILIFSPGGLIGLWKAAVRRLGSRSDPPPEVEDRDELQEAR